MKALLRFQTIVAVRALISPASLSVVAIPFIVLVVLSSSLSVDRLGTPAIALIAFAVMAGMGATFDALDAVRWRAPIGRPQVLAAHFLFWTIALAPPIAAVAAVVTGDAAGTILLFANAMLVALAAAAVVPLYQRWRRNVTFDSAMTFMALFFVVAGLGTWSAILAVLDRGAIALAPSCAALCVAVTAGCQSYFREERLPAASGPDDPRDIAPARRMPRTPAASLRTGGPNRGWVVTNVVLALVAQFIPGSSLPVPALLLLSGALSLASSSLASCRWLFASPMDRARLFRRCFLPVLALLIGGATIRSFVEELRPDRSVFFDTFRPNMKGARHRDALVLGHVLDVAAKSYLPPDIPFMAERVREHLWTSYRLDVTKEEVEAPIRRGWSVSGPYGGGDTTYASQEAVFDAMERVQADLEDKIIAADRRRILVNACGVILICLVMLRGQLLGFKSYWATTTLWLVGCAAFFAPQFAPESPIAQVVMHASRAVFTFVRDTPAPLTVLGFVALCAMFWKNCERAFRRLDITDLPPATMAEWQQSRSA